MNIGFFGPPGAGKGTQAVLVSQKLKLPHISTGDMFRAAMREETPVGLEAKAFIEKGALVPDDVTIRIVQERLQKPDCAAGFLLDGFPRTVDQADALQKIAPLHAVVNLEVSDEALIRRLSGRRGCPECGENTHIEWLGEDKAHCPKCGALLSQRPDDNPESIRTRLSVYHAQTAPLIEYYARRGILRTVDGAGDVQRVLSDILDALEGDS